MKKFLLLLFATLFAATSAWTQTTYVNALGSSGWFSDDTRNTTGVDLVGVNSTQFGKPGQIPSYADDAAIADQLQFVEGPAGGLYGGAVKIIAPVGANSAKSTISTVKLTGFAPASDLVGGSFNAAYKWYVEKVSTWRTVAFRIGVQSTQWTTSQTGFTATRSGEQTWDLILVYLYPATTPTADGWFDATVDKDNGIWALYRQAGNTFFPSPPAAQTLAAWNSDAYWGPILFGSGAKITNVQFGLGSGQQGCNAYVDYLKTTILNGGNVIDFVTPPTPITTIVPVATSTCGNYNFQLKVQDFVNVGAISLLLNYDVAKIDYLNFTQNPAFSNGIALMEYIPGQLTISYMSSSGITLAENDVLLTLNFNLLPSASGIGTDLTWSTIPEQREYAGPTGVPIYTSTFTDLTWTIPVRPVKNMTTLIEYCKIQDAIDAIETLNTHEIQVSSGTYDEQVLVNKELIIKGVGLTKPIVNYTGTVTGKPTLFDVSKPNVTIENFEMQVDLVKLSSAIIATSTDMDNITVKSNDIKAIGSSNAAYYGAYGNRNAVSINYGGPINYRVATGGVDNIIFQDNTVSGVVDDGFGMARFFRSGISVDEGSGSFTGNTATTINHDILVRFANGGAVTVTGNYSYGGGMEFSDFNAGSGALTISGNNFDGTFAITYSNALRLKNNYTGRTTTVSNNTFTGFEGNVAGYGGTLSLENYQAVTIDNNTFTPLTSSTVFRHITLNTKDFSSSSGSYAPVVDATFTNNVFNGSGTPGGIALGFYNWDNDSPTFNAITIGTAGNENIFNDNIGTFIYLDNSTGTVAPNATTMVPWAVNLDAQNNKFALSPPTLPSAMTFAQLFDLEDRITHKIDDQRLGFVLVLPNNAYVTDITTAAANNNDYTRIRNAVDYVSDNWTINLHGTFDWTETNAAASWALGNDEVSGNDDDYTILVPAGLEGVTFTAPIGLGDARISGPGDLASVNLEGTLNFWLGNNRNWTISNMEIFDFDMAIGMFFVGTTDYNNTVITNNHIRIPADLNTTIAPADVNQNIGIHYAFGTNQTFSNNTFTVAGDGVSIGTNYSVSIVMQSNTSGGVVYDGLKIKDNTITVTGVPASDPAVIRGIWENGSNSGAAIEISGNIFTNAEYANTADLNRQVAFWVTSRSGATKKVEYKNNEVSGFNEGVAWIGGLYTSYGPPLYQTGDYPVEVMNNKFDKMRNAVVVRKAVASTNPGSPAQINENSFTNFASGGFAIKNEGTGDAASTCNWYGTNTVAGVVALVNGPVVYDPWLVDGTDDPMGGVGFQPKGTCTGATNLYVNDLVSDNPTNDIYTTAIGSDANPGTAAAPFLTITKAVNTAVDGTKIWVDAGTFQEQVFIGKTVDITGVSLLKTIVKAPVTMVSTPVSIWSINEPVHPIMFAYDNAKTIKISKITVDGDNGRTINKYFGVLYYEANGTFTNSKITSIHDAGTFSGAQAGIAFYGGHIRTATLAQNITFTYNLVDDFQKGGVVVDAPGTYGIIDNNVITGQNVALVTAQNGIQLSRGAYGSVQNNAISNCIWNKVEHPHEYTAAGILLYQAGTSTVSGNTLSGNEVGVMSYSSTGITYSGDIYANNKIHLWLDAAGDVSGGNAYDKTVLNPAIPEAVFGCIQYAIDEATPAGGDILTASAGTFAENVVVHTPVSILGPKATVSGCDAGRGTGEAIVVPFTNDVYGEIFHVAASNVTIKGFTIDGDNPVLPTNGYGFGGADMHAAEGVTVYETGVNNLIVTNNIFQNLLYFGVTLYDYPAGVASTGHVISYNKFKDLGTYNPASTMDYWGGGVLLYNNQYTKVANNCMENVRLGIQTGNFWKVNSGLAESQLITDNTIQARRVGIFHNLHYSAASPITLSNNTINALSNTNETRWNGITLSSLSVPSYSTNNIINGNDIIVSNLSKGYEVWNVKNTYPASINEGSVSGVDYGVFANNYEGYSSNGTDGAHAIITGMTVSPKAGGIGIYALYSPSYTGPATTINVQAYNNFITGGAYGVKLAENVAGTVSAIVNNNHITGNSGFGLNSTILNEVNATCNWWGSADGDLIAPKISGNVDYIYWLSDGTDIGEPGFVPGGTCAGAPDFTGNYKYYNAAQTKMNNVTVELWKSGSKVYPVSGTVTTNGDGIFTFANVLPDTYEVRANTVKPVGGINSTDAAQVNYWGVNISPIEKVRWLAGDVAGSDFKINANDANLIQQYFLTQGNPIPSFSSTWSFWLTGDQISANPGVSLGYPQVTVPSVGTTVTRNFYGLVTGDFNRSFTPNSAKSGNEYLSLEYGDVVEVSTGSTFALPVYAGMDMEVGALTVILTIPAGQLEIQHVYLGGNPDIPVQYEVSGDEVRLSWYSMVPLQLQKGEILLTIELAVTGSFSEEFVYVTLADDILNELADGTFTTIEKALLTVGVIKDAAFGIHSAPAVAQIRFVNQPNPFKGTTNFVYNLPTDGHVTIEIHDIVGNRLGRVADGFQQAGEHTMTLDAGALQPGVYTATLILNSSDNMLLRTIKIIKN